MNYQSLNTSRLMLDKLYRRSLYTYTACTLHTARCVLSQTQDPGSSIAESSQGIIRHSQEQGLRPTEVNPGIGDMVEIHLRQIKRGRNSRSVTAIGRVTQVNSEESKILNLRDRHTL